MMANSWVLAQMWQEVTPKLTEICQFQVCIPQTCQILNRICQITTAMAWMMMTQVNDRSDIRKQPFGGPQPSPAIVLEPDNNELHYFYLFFLRFLLELGYWGKVTPGSSVRKGT